MHFDNFREMSVKIGNDKKALSASSENKRRMHSASGRHYDDR